PAPDERRVTPHRFEVEHVRKPATRGAFLKLSRLMTAGAMCIERRVGRGRGWICGLWRTGHLGFISLGHRAALRRRALGTGAGRATDGHQPPGCTQYPPPCCTPRGHQRSELTQPPEPCPNRMRMKTAFRPRLTWKWAGGSG